jgi:hypothetical protein
VRCIEKVSETWYRDMSRHSPSDWLMTVAVAPDLGKTDRSKSGAFGPAAAGRSVLASDRRTTGLSSLGRSLPLATATHRRRLALPRPWQRRPRTTRGDCSARDLTSIPRRRSMGSSANVGDGQGRPVEDGSRAMAAHGPELGFAQTCPARVESRAVAWTDGAYHPKPPSPRAANGT